MKNVRLTLSATGAFMPSRHQLPARNPTSMSKKPQKQNFQNKIQGICKIQKGDCRAGLLHGSVPLVDTAGGRGESALPRFDRKMSQNEGQTGRPNVSGNGSETHPSDALLCVAVGVVGVVIIKPAGGVEEQGIIANRGVGDVTALRVDLVSGPDGRGGRRWTALHPQAICQSRPREMKFGAGWCVLTMMQGGWLESQ